jgi:hypothetical protein
VAAAGSGWLAALALGVIGLVTFAGTSSKRAADVAFLLSTLQEERYQKDVKYFEAHAKSLGMRSVVFAADNDNARQLAQIEDALSRGAKVLVIQPTDSAAAGSYVARAHAAGAKVVAYDRSIPGADFYVAHDSYRVGVIQAEAPSSPPAARASTSCPGRPATGRRDHARLPGDARARRRARRHQDRRRAEPQLVVARAGAAHRRGALLAGGRVDATREQLRMARGAVRAAGVAGVFIARRCRRANVTVCEASRRSRCSGHPAAAEAAVEAPRRPQGRGPPPARIPVAGAWVVTAAVLVEAVTPNREGPDRRPRVPRRERAPGPTRLAAK